MSAGQGGRNVRKWRKVNIYLICHQKKVFIKVCLNDTVIIYSISIGGSMEFLEVSARLEFISLLTKVSRIEGVTFKEQQIALSLIGEWAAEIDALIRAEKKKPLEGGLLSRSGLQ